jgi:hypothetical protein
MTETLTDFQTYRWHPGLTIRLKSRRISGGSPNIVPLNIQPPTIYGIPTAGQTLNGTPGQWSLSPSGFLYQWTRNGVNIPGATSATYTLVTADEGASLALAVIAQNIRGNSLPAISNLLGPIAAPLAISGVPVTTAALGVPYAGFTVTGSGGWTPYSYNLTAGRWPNGIVMNGSTGVVSGTPTSDTTQNGIVITVWDHYGLTANLAPFNIMISGPSLDFELAKNSQYVALGVV